MVQGNESEEVGLLPEDDSLGSQIRELLSDGHTGKAIIDMGYKESTVRQEARKMAKRNGKPTNSGPMLPVKLGKGDTIPIESELTNIKLQDGEYKLGFIDGMRVLVLGAKLNQMLTANLSETTASQLALLKEAKSDEKGVAQETVLEMLPHFAEMIKETARASSPNPMGSMLVRMMEPLMTNAFSGMTKMFPGMPQAGQGQAQGLPPGWEKKEGGEQK